MAQKRLADCERISRTQINKSMRKNSGFSKENRVYSNSRRTLAYATPHLYTLQLIPNQLLIPIHSFMLSQQHPLTIEDGAQEANSEWVNQLIVRYRTMTTGKIYAL